MWVQYGGGLYDRENPRSTNELFQFPTMGFATFHTSSFIDLRSVHTCYVHSPSFGNYSCLAPRGVRTALCKIPCNVAYGSVLTFEHSGSQYDYIDVGSTTLKMLTFELKDARGNFIAAFAGTGNNWIITRPRLIADVLTLDSSLQNSYVSHVLQGRSPVSYTNLLLPTTHSV